jgi:acyl-CoA hydrolase
MEAKAHTEPRRVHQHGSQVHIDEWVSPDIADERGFLRAGKILEWMDVVGVVAAARHCRLPVVTASVDGLVLRDPIGVGEHVTMSASVGHTSERSIGVSVAMTLGRPGADERLVLHAYMSFVAVDDRGNPAIVPQLVPETPAEVARFREGRLRREFRKKLATGAPGVPLPAAGQPADRETKLFILELLKSFPRALRFPWERERPSAQGRSSLYGGTLMRWIETNAALSARAYLKGAPVRLAGLHGLTFLRPIRPNRFVHIQSVVVHAGADSVTVLVSVHAEDPIEGDHEDTLRAFLTYAPIEGHPPAPLTCETDDERAVFDEVEGRLALQRMLEPDAVA